VEALQPHHCKKRKLAEDGAWGPRLSATIPVRLSRLLEVATPPSPTALQQAREAEAAEVRRLCSLAHPVVVQIFEFVREKMLIHNIEDTLPYAGCFAHWHAYNQVNHVRIQHTKSQLRDEDYALLARTPQVLGPTVYGALEMSEGGWHWSFEPTGVDVRSEPFASVAAAREDLRAVQIMLFPGWLQGDKEQRAARLRQLLQRRRCPPASSTTPLYDQIFKQLSCS